MPTAAHIIYIPAMLCLGFVLGYIFGGRATQAALADEQARAEAKARRRAARAAEQAAAESSPSRILRAVSAGGLGHALWRGVSPGLEDAGHAGHCLSIGGDGVKLFDDARPSSEAALAIAQPLHRCFPW